MAWKSGDWDRAADALARTAARTDAAGDRARLALARQRAERAPPAELPDAPTAEAVGTYLGALRSEIELLREALEDG